MKSLIFAVDGEIVLAYVSGANQLDEAKLAAPRRATCSRVDADVVRRPPATRSEGCRRSDTPPSARVRRPRSAAVRRGVGGGRDVARRVPIDPGRAGPRQRRGRRRARSTMKVDTAAIRGRAARSLKRFDLTLAELRDRARSLRPSSFDAAVSQVASGAHAGDAAYSAGSSFSTAQRVPPQDLGAVLHHGGARPPSRSAPWPAGARLRRRTLTDRARPRLAGVIVVATDQPSAQAGRGAPAASTRRSSTSRRPSVCPDNRFTGLVSFEPVDMTAIPRHLYGFDGLWSSCCFEHLGSPDAGFDFVMAAMDACGPVVWPCTRPSSTAATRSTSPSTDRSPPATTCVLSGARPAPARPSPARRRTQRAVQLLRQLVASGGAQGRRSALHAQPPHRLRVGDRVMTSFGLEVVKGGDPPCPG